LTESYRGHFKDDEAANAYDLGQYAPDSYWDLVWSLERERIDEFVARLVRTGRSERYLDFACGTGRLLAHLEDSFAEAYGIDVSPAMLARARERVRKANLIEVDLTRSPGPPVEFDLITAFRFVLNAEPALRRAALSSLAAYLKPEGRLLLNTHGNPWSFKALVRPMRWVRARLGGTPLENYLSAGDLRGLVAEAGLEVEERWGMGLLPWQVHRVLPRRLSLWFERRLGSLPLVSRLGVNQVLACRKAAVSGS